MVSQPYWLILFQNLNDEVIFIVVAHLKTTMNKLRFFVFILFFTSGLAGFLAFSEQPEPAKKSKPKHSKKEIHKSSKELKVLK